MVLSTAAIGLTPADERDDPPDSQPATQPETQPATAPAKEPQTQPATDEARPRRRRARGDAASGPSSSQAATSSTSTSTSTGTSSSQAAEKKDKFLAITNGRIVTVTGPVIDGGTVLCKNGKIDQIGRAIQLPQDCEVIDARGKWVYPGLVTAAAVGLHLGNPPEDNTDVFAQGMNIAVASGLTCALSGNDALKLSFGSVDDMVVRRAVFYNLNYPRTGVERDRFLTEMHRVHAYLRDLARHEIDKQRDKDAKPPDKEWIRGRFEEFRKLLAGESTAVQSANAADELIELTELSNRFGFDLVIRGAHEGWIVASALGRAGCSVVMTPRTLVHPDDRRNAPNGSTIENAKLLHDAGVPIAIIPASQFVSVGGLAGRDLQHLNMEAAFAVRGGLSNEDALRAITIDAARIIGVDDRVGSLESGKDADLFVCDGDILHYMTQVHYTVVNGRLVYSKSRDSLFAHIRPEGKPEIPQFDDQWPRRLEWRD
jgi:cytosine/adenosine deaminase-related metal-dependent hydrolase